jgi:hypothetical protein
MIALQPIKIGNNYYSGFSFEPLRINPKYLEIFATEEEKRDWKRYNELMELPVNKFLQNIEEFKELEIKLIK